MTTLKANAFLISRNVREAKKLQVFKHRTTMIMLPIPVSIIGSSKRRLFIPLIYVALTASFSYIFLLTFLKVNTHHYRYSSSHNHFQKSKPFSTQLEDSGINLIKTPLKLEREVQTYAFLDAYADTKNKIPEAEISVGNQVEVDSFPSEKSKDNNNNIHNGTWRSNSPEIRFGHQDLIDIEGPSFQPWPNDEACRNFHIHFARKGTFKPRALVSFPGSGNSWLRHLIEGTTGFFTGSVFNDKKINSSGLLGELRPPNDGTTIVQKTHHDAFGFSTFSSAQLNFYAQFSSLLFNYQGILIIRSPFDALLSYWNYLGSRDHRSYGPQPLSNPEKWTSFVLTMMPKWTSLITSWVENSQNSVLIVIYEKLKKNPREELIRILQYLDQPVDEGRLQCVLKSEHMEGPFHRRHKNKNKNSSLSNNPFLLRVTETDEKRNVLDNEASVWEQNSKSRMTDLLQRNSSVKSSLFSLDLFVQSNVQQINDFFHGKNIPIFLDYAGPKGA